MNVKRCPSSKLKFTQLMKTYDEDELYYIGMVGSCITCSENMAKPSNMQNIKPQLYSEKEKSQKNIHKQIIS